VHPETIREESVHVTAAPIAPAGRIRHGPEPIDRAEERGFVRRLQRDGRCKNIAVRGPASGRGVRGIISDDRFPFARQEQRLSASRRPAFDMITHSPEQTRSAGALLGRLLRRGDVVLLTGTLGAGKTTFVQGIARALQSDEFIQSPTFTLVAEHDGVASDGRAVRLYHVDLYRLAGTDDVGTLGLDDYFDDPDGVTVIEWPDRSPASMPETYLLVDLQFLADTKRNLRLSPEGERHRATIERFRSEVAGVRG
jgi:tRNA threonylcarbamoyladenosine biosynthesis protein TsaE